jgi:hypothetical protein
MCFRSVGYCPPVATVDQGYVVSPTRTMTTAIDPLAARVGDKLTVQCSEGHTIGDSQRNIITCMPDFSWSPEPACKGRFLHLRP